MNIPYWIRHTPHCPIKRQTGYDASGLSAKAYYLLAKEMHYKHIRHAKRWVDRNIADIIRFKHTWRNAPKLFKEHFTYADGLNPARRNAFFEQLARYNPNNWIKRKPFDPN